MTPHELLSKAQARGVSVEADGPDLVLRSEAGVPEELVEEMRRSKADLLRLLIAEQEVDDYANDPIACRGCAEVIPGGTTLCVACASSHSPLVRYALELSALTEERTLRGRALGALDRRRYPKLVLPGGSTVGPGLLAWCPVLREGNAATFRAVLKLVERVKPGKEEEHD